MTTSHQIAIVFSRQPFALDSTTQPPFDNYRYDYQSITFNDHGHHQRHHNPYAVPQPPRPVMAAALPPHARQPSSDSATSPTQERRVRIAIPGEPIQSPQQSGQQQRASIPGGIEFRDSCGSPTDSGYRSVPRSDDTPDQPPAGTQNAQPSLVTSRTPFYTAMPKSVFSLSGSHLQQSGPGDQQPRMVSESATCNILIIPNNGGGNGNHYGNCSASTAALIATPPPPIQQAANGRKEADSGGRRPKTRPKNSNGHGTRLSSVPPLVHHQSSGLLRQSLDDTAAIGIGASANGSVPCHSPYSDLSSPSYATSTTSSSAASTSQAASRASQQQLSSSIHGQTPPSLVSKIGGSSTSVLAQQQHAINGGPSGAAVGASFDTINTNVSLPEEFSLERCPKLIELDRIPWNEKDVVAVLQKGRTRTLVNQIAIDVVPRLTYLLQRPLVRIAREAQRLCQRFNKCTKFDIQYATKVS